MELRQETTLRQIITITPQLILAQRLLQLPTLELRMEIHNELIENPALELEEIDVCPFCFRPIENERCENCGRHEISPAEEEINHFLKSHMSECDWEETRYGSDEEEHGRYTDFIHRDGSLQDFLLYNFYTQDYPKGHKRLGEYLIYSIDDDGLLHYDMEDVKERFGVDEGQIEEIVSILQGLEPPGVAARSPQEALLIQLRILALEGKSDPHAEQIIREHLEELGKNKLEEIAEGLDVTIEEVECSLSFIRRNLNPYPGRSYHERSPTNADSIRPSMAIKHNGRDLTYEVLELADLRLRINPQYAELYQRHCEGDILMPRDEAEHIREYCRRAKFFLDSINSRRHTLEKIAEALCEQQRDFLIQGLPNFNDTLTQSRLAELISLHESTVSRAMSGKYVQLPSGDVVSFDFFFDSSVRPKEYIRNIVAREDTEHPLADAEICEYMKQKGFNLARRTVAKYREELNIPPSFQRRRLHSRIRKS
ncbi:MAG: RNA polymerase factor sigma-54 [bacterium]